ncbi:microtubule associated protein-domain-containing protein [Suillus ampliporus]|nr:microtubule associated protein-domain-containing protein [Suillus ampliporus]
MQRAFNASIPASQFFAILRLVGCPSLAEPPLSTKDELQTLQHTLTKAVESRIEVRRKRVDDWIGKCEGVESGCTRYSRALGTHAKVAGSLSDLKAEKVLPRRYEGATVYQEKLRQIYHTKLEQLTTLTNRLNALARTLGSHFFQPDTLTPALVAAEESDDPTALRDLEKELVRGKGEVSKRLNELGEIFIQIDWLYSKLGIDPPTPTITPTVATSSSTLAVPRYSLPRSESSANSTCLNSNADPFVSSTIGPSTPTPSALGTSDNHILCPSSSPPHPTISLPEVPEFPNEREYIRSLGRFIKLLDSSPQDSLPGPLLNSCGVEPTQGILAWAERLHAELNELKRRREVHIQAMYDQLETLWRRMGVGEAMDGFVEANRGTTPPVVQAYEEELERMIDLKRERIGEFIANARTEIENLWEELMVGGDERDDFAAFADDEHAEDLLSQHEHEIARLKAEVRLKIPLLTSIRKYIEICDEEKEKELGRRVGKEKPKLEQQLLSSLPTWEQTHGRAFLVHGESILQLLTENASANEQENRKRIPTSQYSMQVLNKGLSQSLKPAASSGANGASKGGYVPGKSNAAHHGVVTPAVRPGSPMSSNTHGTNKRQKLADGAHHTITRPASPTRGRTPSGKSALPRSATQNAPPMPSQSKNMQGYATLGYVSGCSYLNLSPRIIQAFQPLPMVFLVLKGL